MKTFVIVFSWMLCIACILPSQLAIAQHDNIRCGTMEYLEKQKKADPTLETRMQQQEEQLQLAAAAMKRAKSFSLGKGKPGSQPPPPFQTVTIPVVVHIVENPSNPMNIPDQYVFDQIAITNRDFAGLNPNPMGSFAQMNLKADTKFQFCLARVTPNGAPTNGIHRVTTTMVDFPVDNSVKYTSRGGCDAWDPTRYFNIWVCRLQGYAGYAQFPTAGLNIIYGVVVHGSCFGFTDPVQFYRGGGGTTTHEIGHCFNLRHIWADDQGACNGTDYCDDTPNQADYTLNGAITNGNIEITDACSPSSPGINFQNFMDYSRDLVLANFTPDQALRMQACFAPGGPLVPLLSSTVCEPPDPNGCPIPAALAATSLTKTTATLTWMAMYNNSSGYNIRYRKTSTSGWTYASSMTNVILITGLTKKTKYEFQVESVCSGGGSGYSASSVFQTSANIAPKDAVFDEPGAPTALTISPNPVYGPSTISYTLTEPGTSSISIVNALGAEIARLSSGRIQDAGTYSLPYDASRLIPGLYFVRYSNGRTIETTKFVIRR